MKRKIRIILVYKDYFFHENNIQRFIYYGVLRWIKVINMTEHNKQKYTSSMDVMDKNGDLLGAVCVTPSKEIGKRDILLMDEKAGTQSVRSTTELINMLSKKDVPFDERKMVLDFLAERLGVLEQELAVNTLKSLNESKKQ
jgi:hypothetical protein